MSYVSAQEQVRRELGIDLSAATLLDRWRDLVEQCQDGYRWDVSELHNELRARDALEQLLAAPSLQAFTEHVELVGSVATVDAAFRLLLQPDVAVPGEHSWWRKGVLRYSGAEYSDYMAAAYGFRVERRPGSE